jgi:hypothetical protein
LLLFSLWFNYSRKIMPDTFSVSFVFIGLYYGSNFLDKKNSYLNLLLYFLFSAIGLLSKLPAAYFFTLMPLLIFKKEIALSNKIKIILTTFLVAIITGAYYFVWLPHVTNTYGFTHFFMGTGFRQGIQEIYSHLNEALQKFYEEAIGFSGLVIFLFGIGMAIKNKERKLLEIFLLAFIGFLLIIFKSGFAFYHHSYYIIPFAPIMALLSGYALTQIKNKKWVLIILICFSLESLLKKNADFYIKENNMAMLNLEEDLNKFSSKNDLIAINSGNVPTPMYFAHRRGWVETNEALTNNAFVDSLKRKGLKFIVILKKTFNDGDISLTYPIVLENKDYKIYIL